MTAAKDYIVEGLSYRLNNYQAAIRDDQNIMNRPRACYKGFEALLPTLPPDMAAQTL